jgi:hypothetical protein
MKIVTLGRNALSVCWRPSSGGIGSVPHRKATVHFKRYCLVSGITLALAGCTGSGVPSTPPAQNAQVATVTNNVGHPSPTASAWPNLYVLNPAYPGHISVYSPGHKNPTRTISQVARRALADMAFDPTGNLYVGVDGGSRVKVFPPGSSTSVRTITNGIKGPTALTLDNVGRLYVANELYGSITVYASGKSKLLRTIKNGSDEISQLLTDKKNNLYAAEYNEADGSAVIVYSSGGKKALYELGQENSRVGQLPMVLDGESNLYVGSPTNTITIYKAFTPTVLRTITQGATSPTALAMNAVGDLYCVCGGAVAVYPSGHSSPSYTITDGIDQPIAIAIGRSGKLYVANLGSESVTVYAPGSSEPSETITIGVSGPTSLAFGP